MMAGLTGGFFFDDHPNIVENEAIQISSLDAASLRHALSGPAAGPLGRPVSVASFALTHYFFGLDAFPFKAVNLGIHLFVGALVYGLAVLLLQMARVKPGQSRQWVPLWLAALWLLHPIQVTPVLHVVQRMTSLSALFLFAALLVHVIARTRGGRAGATGLLLAWGILWPLSFFSKETGVLFPFFALAWELILRRAEQGKPDRFACIFAVLTGLTFVGCVIYFILPAGQWLWAGYALREFTLPERLLTEGRVLWLYLGLILFPRLEALGLYHDDIPLSVGLLEPWTTLPAWLGLAGLAWLAWRLRKRAPLVCFGITWFFIGHAMESTALPLEIAHEHRNYVPLFGLLLAAAAPLSRALEAGGARKTLGFTLAGAALLYFPFVTALRAHQFGDDVRRTQIEAQHHRGSARAQFEAGKTLANLPDAAQKDSPAYGLARAHFERTGELDDQSKASWLGLIFIACRAGALVEREWVDELSRRLRETPFAPGDSTTMFALKEMEIAGRQCLMRSDVERLFTAAHSNPTVSRHVRSLLHSWLADYFALGVRDLPAAEIELDRALSIAPHNPSNRLKRAQLDFLQGRHDEATRRLDELGDAVLVRSERATLALLRDCLASGRPAARCAAM
ncbi:MAG: pilus assembly protein PilF [Rhodocyclales bacterium]|nr:MAG: pilus assembly protein PilF [Rhodocyclales bacterium]